MSWESVHIGHDDRFLRGGDMATDAFAERNTQTAKRSLIGADNQFAILQRVHDIETGPEKSRFEGLSQDTGCCGISRSDRGFPRHNGVNFRLEIPVEFCLVHILPHLCLEGAISASRSR